MPLGKESAGLAYPPGCPEDNLLEEFKFTNVEFLPANTTLVYRLEGHFELKKALPKPYFSYDSRRLKEETLLHFMKPYLNHFHIANCFKSLRKPWMGSLGEPSIMLEEICV